MGLKETKKRSASRIVGCAPRVRRATCRAPEGKTTASNSWRQTVNETIRFFVGLDVHKESIAVAVAEAGREEPRFLGSMGPELGTLRKALQRIGTAAQILIVYEAGPSGYALWRDLCARGYRCEVIAPSKIARRPGDRIKTDRRDALLLARLEAGWNYRFPARISRGLQVRQEKQLKPVRDIAWKAQRRLSERYRRLLLRRSLELTPNGTYCIFNQYQFPEPSPRLVASIKCFRFCFQSNPTQAMETLRNPLPEVHSSKRC